MSAPPMTFPIDVLAEVTGKSPKFWEREAAARKIPHRRFGKTPRFTAEDIQAIFDRYMVRPKTENPATSAEVVAPDKPVVDPLTSRVTRNGGDKP